MFKRQHRLRKEREIVRVYQKGRGAVSDDLGIKALRNPQGQTRTAIVVSKKVDKRAVVRNRNRRRIAGILRSQGETYLSGYDIVVTVRRDLSALSQSELSARLTTLLTRSEHV